MSSQLSLVFGLKQHGKGHGKIGKDESEDGGFKEKKERSQGGGKGRWR